MNELSEGCVVCGRTAPSAEFDVPEAMFRIGESFTYRNCLTCGTIQIADVPADMAAYYGANYYSYQPANGRVFNPIFQNKFSRLILRANTFMYLNLGAGQGVPWARTAGIRPNDKVLDIGCGSGENLLRLRSYGYRNLAGADPFLDRTQEVAPGLKLEKAFHHDLRGQYDWLLMHHAFEHVPDPRAMLRSAHRLLGPAGGVVLRLPLAGGWAWRVYGSDWVQLDAPRHLVLYSLSGLRELAEQEGFTVSRVEYDSTDFQFWGSELVRKEIPHRHGPQDSFSSAELQEWQRRAQELNASLDGDQAVVVLRKSSPAAQHRNC